MEIVSIFAKNLFAFRYPEDEMDEFERLFDCWTDVEFLETFFDENEIDITGDFWHTTVEGAVRRTLEEARLFEKKMLLLAANSEQQETPDLDCLFKPLDNMDSGLVELSLNKSYGVNSPSWLRIYAIKLESNCYIVTGGAIKLTKKMNGIPHLEKELRKMDHCKRWLRSKGIIDSDGI